LDVLSLSRRFGGEARGYSFLRDSGGGGISKHIKGINIPR
jgi:hypothetical protein